MKSFFILVSIVTIMLTGCGSEYSGASSDADSVASESNTKTVVESTINEPAGLVGLDNVPPVPSFPSE